jgi:CHAT domain-containing protein/Tfp pilus assembly protein PilF
MLLRKQNDPSYKNFFLFSMVAAMLAIVMISCSDRQSPSENIHPDAQVDSETSRGIPAPDVDIPGSYVTQAKQFAKDAQHDSAIAYFEKASRVYEEGNDWENYARCYNQMGKSAWYNWALEQAAFYLDKALKTGIYHLGENHPAVAESYYLFGLVYTDQDDFERVIQSLNKALSIQLNTLGELHLDVAKTYNVMGLYYEKRGRYDQALIYYEKGLVIKKQLLGEQDPEVAISCNNMAIAYWQKGDYERAFGYGEQAISIFRAAYGEEHHNMGFAYNDLANIYQQKGDYDQALFFYEKAVSIHRTTLGEESAHTGVDYLNIAQVHFDKGNYDSAIEYSEKSLAIFLNTMGEDGDEVAYCYITLGNSYSEKGDNSRALRYYDKALVIFTARYGEQHPTVAKIYDSKGMIFYRHRGNYRRARVFFDNALSIRQALLGERHPEVAVSYNNKGDMYLSKSDYNRAIAFYQQALRANLPAFTTSDWYVNPPLEGALSEEELLRSLQQKAHALTMHYHKRTKRSRDLEAAVSNYDGAARLIDQIRRGYKAEGSKLILAKKVSDIYENGMQSALQSYRLTGDERYRKMAFRFAEKSKSSILIEALSEAEAKKFAGIPDSLLEQERDLRIDLAYYERNLSEERLKREAADSASLALWQNKLFDLKQRYDALLEKFETEYPAYFQMKYQVKTVTVAELQEEVLDENSTLIEYVLGEDSIYIFIVSPGQLDITAVANDSLFERQLKQLRKGIVMQNMNGYASAARWLYQRLIAPVEDQLAAENLIIIPDGQLNYVSFEVLLTAAVEGAAAPEDYRALPFLLKKHAVSYAYSATLLSETIHRKRPEPPRDYLGYAPVFFPGGMISAVGGETSLDANPAGDSLRSTTLSPLPATKAEVLNIQNLFLQRSGFWKRLLSTTAVVYLNEYASEANLKSASLDKYSYLHFATHGFISENEPKLSGLRLAPDSLSSEDGILYLGEIYNLSLKADLVVLSACETGLGKLARGEGLIGLTRGFLYAGAQNLLVSLWQVNDASTAHLMVDFYNSMLDGKSKSAALRKAKLALMERDSKYARPYYWAPFVLIGK